MRAATIKDVARLAGVAISTASLSLSGHPSVRPETRERVTEAARRLRYRPNAIARSLVTRHTNTLGLLIPDIGDPYYHEVFRGIDQWAREHEYSVILGHTERDPSQELKILQVFLGKQVDGVIFAGGGIHGDRHLLHLQEEATPIVLVGRHELPLPSVVPLNEEGAYEAVSHLVAEGHERIGMIAGPEILTASEDRLAGYLRALREHGLSWSSDWVIRSDFTAEGGAEAMRALLQVRPRLTAIFAATDHVGIGAVQAIYSAGLSIPDDLAVIGFGDIPLSRFLWPPLSTVRMPLRKMGRMAAEWLHELIQHPEELSAGLREMQREVGLELVKRASSLRAEPAV